MTIEDTLKGIEARYEEGKAAHEAGDVERRDVCTALLVAKVPGLVAAVRVRQEALDDLAKGRTTVRHVGDCTEDAPCVACRALGNTAAATERGDAAEARAARAEAQANYLADEAAEQRRRAERAERLARQAFRDLEAALNRERELRCQLGTVNAGAEDVWRWQGEGDDPASLTCPVVMSAETLRALLARVEKAEGQARGLRTDAENEP